MTIDKINLDEFNKKGKVSRILPDGYGYVQSDENDISQQYVFSFRAIPNYRGESVRELNLHSGTPVAFVANGSKIERILIGPDYSEFLNKRGIQQEQ
jgi:hypothetical protein